MISDYYINNIIFTTHTNEKNKIDKIECYNKTTKQQYITTKKEEIKRVIEYLKQEFENVKGDF